MFAVHSHLPVPPNILSKRVSLLSCINDANELYLDGLMRPALFEHDASWLRADGLVNAFVDVQSQQQE